jgi:hypothetical protein
VSAVSTLGVTESPAPANRLVTLPQFPIGDTPTLGFIAVDWAERNLRHPNGPHVGKPWRYQGDQVNFLLWAYALDFEARWLFNHLARRLAKGSGKSPFAATFALIEFLAPVRLERFDDRVLGGCIGRPVDMPLVHIAATAESQTSNTMRFVRAFCPKRGQLARDYQLDVGKTQIYKLPEGTLEQITSSSTAEEGAQTTAAVADETEKWTPTQGGDDLMATIADNLTKTAGRMLETANAWEPGIESVAEATWDDWLAQEEGRLQGQQRILYDARLAPSETDMSDPRSLRAALEHVYRFAPWIDIDVVMERIWRKSSKPSDSKRKYLNHPATAEGAWIDPETFKLLGPGYHGSVIADGDEVALFFDGSKSRDASALVACRLDDGHVATLGVWEPEPDTEVDPSDVDRVVQLAFDRFKVAAFFADVKEWESWALTEWPRRYADDLDVFSAPQARPQQSIAWDMRGHAYEFAKAVEACEAEILAGAFTHDGNSALVRHVTNCRRRAYRDAVTIGKESKDSPKKIDAAVAMVGARLVRRYVLADPGRKRRKKSGSLW